MIGHENCEQVIEALRAARTDAVRVEAVMAIDTAEIARQRALGWPDFHPELFCHRCGQRNLTSWCVDSALWNEVLDLAEIVCPRCFVEAWEAKHGGYITWRIEPADDRPPQERDR